MLNPELLTLSEVAEFFRCSSRTILRYEKDGLIPPRLSLPGKQALWHPQDLIVFVESIRSKEITRPKLGAPTKSEFMKKVKLVSHSAMGRMIKV